MTAYSTNSLLGYAIPGAVIAVGVMIPMMGIDRMINWTFSNQMGMILSERYLYWLLLILFGLWPLDIMLLMKPEIGVAVNEVARSASP